MPTARLVRIDSATTLKRKERAFAKEAARKLDSVVRKRAFLDQVRGARYSSSLWLSPTNAQMTLPPERVAEIISSGVEGGIELANGRIDLTITLVNLPNGALAATFPHDAETRTDTDFFKSCFDRDDPVDLAAVWMHEWMHAAGFVHETAAGDKFDVPYTLQRIVQALGSPGGTRSARGKFAPARQVMARNGAVLWNCPATRRTDGPPGCGYQRRR